MNTRLGGLLAVFIAASSISGCGTKCPAGCPAVYLSVAIGIVSSLDGGVVSDVEVAFSGPSEGSMKCETTAAGTACFWPDTTETEVEGMYLLQISAFGYKPAKINATMAIIPDRQCNCDRAALTPSRIVLDPL